jgi:hypothetical protein
MTVNEQNLKDIQIKCRTCGDTFTFEVGEQLYYLKKQLQFPKNCHYCRLMKKLQRLEDGGGNG